MMQNNLFKKCIRMNWDLCIFALFMALVPLWLGQVYWLEVLSTIGLYAILALSLNLILGHAGLFHMGHATFYAVGAYTTAILNTQYGIPTLWTLPLAACFAGLVALCLARPIIHLRGDYLLVVTIGIVIITSVALKNNIFGLTGGNNGIFGIAPPSIFGFSIVNPKYAYLLIWGFLGISVLLFHWLENSRFGRALNYIKQDDIAAEGSGINITQYKLTAFVIGAIWAGMAGTLFAGKMTVISPESFSFLESVLLFAIVILGGAGSIRGVLLGTALIIGLPEVFRQFESARLLIFGAAMVIMMIFRPQGIFPPLQRHYKVKKLLQRFPCALQKTETGTIHD